MAAPRQGSPLGQPRQAPERPGVDPWGAGGFSIQKLPPSVRRRPDPKAHPQKNQKRNPHSFRPCKRLGGRRNHASARFQTAGQPKRS